MRQGFARAVTPFLYNRSMSSRTIGRGPITTLPLAPAKHGSAETYALSWV